MSSFPSGFLLDVFKTCLLGRGFHTLIKNVSFSSPTDMGSHNPPPLGPRALLVLFSSPIDVRPPPIHPFGASILAGTCSRLQSIWDPQFTLLRGPASSLEHPRVFTSHPYLVPDYFKVLKRCVSINFLNYSKK